MFLSCIPSWKLIFFARKSLTGGWEIIFDQPNFQEGYKIEVFIFATGGSTCHILALWRKGMSHWLRVFDRSNKQFRVNHTTQPRNVHISIYKYHSHVLGGRRRKMRKDGTSAKLFLRVLYASRAIAICQCQHTAADAMQYNKYSSKK